MKQMKKEDIEKKFLEAHQKYSIRKLMQHLKRSNDGTIIVDRDAIIHGEYEFDQFVHILDYDYMTRWKDVGNETVYFEPSDGDYIIGGVYNIVTNEKYTRKIIASIKITNPYNIPTSYICTKKDIDEMRKILSNA